MLLDQVNEPIHGLCLRDIELDWLLADIKIDFSWRPTDITKISICHFAGAIDDTTHDGNLDARQMPGALLDPCGDRLQVEEGSPTGRTGHIIGFEGPTTGGL